VFPGAVTKVSTASPNVGYKLYAAARDLGSPAQTSVTGATVRVDTYDPAAIVVNYLLDVSQAAFVAMETTFITQLTTVFRVTYPTSQAKKWCITVREPEYGKFCNTFNVFGFIYLFVYFF